MIFDSYVTAVSGVAAGSMIQNGNLGSSSGYGFNYWGGSATVGSMDGGFGGPYDIPNLQITTGIMGQAWIATGSEAYYKNYAVWTSSDSSLTWPSTQYVSIGMYDYSPGSSITYQWIRTRAYPPGGVMPHISSSTFSGTGGGGTFTVSNSIVNWSPWTRTQQFAAASFPGSGNTVQTSNTASWGVITVNAVGSLANVTARNNLTEVAWVKFNGGNSQTRCGGIFGSDNGIANNGIQLMEKNATSSACGLLYIGGVNLTGNYLIPLQRLNWTMMTVSWNGRTGTAYVFENSAMILSNSMLAGNSINPSSSQYYFGAENAIGGNTFNGLIANAQLYSQVLSLAQIKQLYSEGPTGLPILGAGLVGWWPFTGNTTDYSGGNTGVVTFNAAFASSNYTFSYSNTSKMATFNGLNGI